MIIKCMANEEKQIDISSSNCFNNQNLKLPIIQSSGITSSRSANKTKGLSIFDSLKYLASENKEKQYANALLKSPKNPQGIEIILQPKTSLEQKKNRIKRVKTDPAQPVSHSNQNKNHSSYKKSIAEKLLKITKELGMGGPDYQNYMKTERKIKTYCNFENENQSKMTYKIKNDLISQSLPLESNKSNDEELNQQKRQIIKNGDNKLHVLNVLRYNLKKKPSVKVQVKHQVQSKESKQKKKSKKIDASLRYTNKSIRGWTKYGKIQQEIENV